MIEFYVIRRVINLTRDILFAYFYLNTIDQSRRSRHMRLLALLPLAMLYFMFSAEDGGFFASAEIRLVYRAVCYFAYLYLSRCIDWKLALYDALLVDSICIINHNLFLTPLTRPILLGDAMLVPSSLLLSRVLCMVIVQSVTLPVLFAVWKTLPLRHIRSVGRTPVILLTTVAGCSMYLNSMLRLMTDNQILSTIELSIFSIILQFALLVCLLLMEQSQYNLRKHAAAEIQLSRVQSTLEIARHNQQSDAQIRKIYHDLKNHIHTLHFLLGSKEYAKAEEYLDRFQSTLPARKPSFHTGSLILDGLLAEKISHAEELGAEVMISADMSPFSTISDFDLCTIFGNILDNALEALAQVSQPQQRYLHLKSQENEGFTIFTMSNSYEGTRLHSASSFATTKHAPDNHGYGISNARTALEKYGGSLCVRDHADKCEFQLSIILPKV